MMHDAPMLADFAVRLSFGLTVLLLAANWRSVPLPFYRTQCQVILGLLVLGALDGSCAGGLGTPVWILIAAAILAYLATIGWGIGLPRIALPLTWVIAVLTCMWLSLASHSDRPAIWLINTASRLSSGFLLGATLAAMLLGHHYLTAPSMSIEPLKRYVCCMSWGLAVRVLLAVVGLSLVHSGILASSSPDSQSGFTLLFVMRWVMGFAGPFVAAILAWKTVQIRSTQSATGILYAAMALVLFGELSSLIGTQAGGLIG